MRSSSRSYHRKRISSRQLRALRRWRRIGFPKRPFHRLPLRTRNLDADGSQQSRPTPLNPHASNALPTQHLHVKSSPPSLGHRFGRCILQVFFIHRLLSTMPRPSPSLQLFAAGSLSPSLSLPPQGLALLGVVSSMSFGRLSSFRADFEFSKLREPLLLKNEDGSECASITNRETQEPRCNGLAWRGAISSCAGDLLAADPSSCSREVCLHIGHVGGVAPVAGRPHSPVIEGRLLCSFAQSSAVQCFGDIRRLAKVRR
jgi:hypothetical protein